MDNVNSTLNLIEDALRYALDGDEQGECRREGPSSRLEEAGEFVMPMNG